MGSSIKKFFLNRDLLILFIVSKVAVILLTIFFYHYFDSLHSYNTWNRWYSRDPDLHPFFLPFSNWDGQHYLLLADYGYIYWQHSQAFFPLFPKCIQFLHFLVRDFYLSAFLVNIIFSYLFLVFFYHYAGELTSRKSAWKCALLVLSYPSAFFLTVFYSEAVFLFLLFGFLYFYRKKSLWSLLFIGFMPLARGQSLFVLFALAGFFLYGLLRKRTISYRYEALNIASILAGFGLYFLAMFLETGSAFAGMSAQQTFTLNLSLSNCLNPVHFIRYLASPSEEWFAPNNSITDKFFIVGMLFSIALIIKIKEPLLILMYLCLAYFPANMGDGGAYIRYSLMAAPLLAIAALKTFPRFKVYPVSLALIAIQIYSLFRFSINDWVG